MNHKKLAALFILGAVIAAAFGAASASAAEYKTKLTLVVSKAGPTYDESYILAVPADFASIAAGWNSIGSITVSRDASLTTSFDVNKKLVVTATSQNGGFLVMSEDNTQTINYTISSDTITDLSSGATSVAFEFSAEEINKSTPDNPAAKTIGVFVEDYSNAKAGTYEDYVTYTATVESANATVTLANMLTEGTVTTVTTTIDGNIVTATLTRTSTGFDVSSSNTAYQASTQVGDNYVGVIFSYGSGQTSSVTLLTDSNQYSPSNLTLQSVTVGGTDITSTLTEQQEK